MKLGEEPFRSDERVNGPRPSRLPFVDVGEALSAAGVPSVEVYADWSEQGLVLLEDLGDATFEAELRARPREGWEALYREALTLLVSLHASEETMRQRGCIAVERRFGVELLAWELEHFREWCLEARGIECDSRQREILDASFSRIVGRLCDSPHGLSHRDFQSRNLMRTGSSLRVIDFQDALLAPVVYDLVALLRDSYVVLTTDEVYALVEYYREQRALAGLSELSSEGIRQDFLWMTVQRKLKDAGRFVFIERVKKDSSFLPYIPDSLAYVRHALGEIEELAALKSVLEELLPEWRETDA